MSPRFHLTTIRKSNIAKGKLYQNLYNVFLNFFCHLITNLFIETNEIIIVY